MRNIAERAASCGDETAATEPGLPSPSPNLRDLCVTPETRSLEPYMTKQGLETILEDVEGIARQALQRRYPGMQASDVDDATQNALMNILAKIDTNTTTLSEPHTWEHMNLPSREPRPDSALLAQEERRLRCLAVRKFWDALGEADIRRCGFREVLLLEALVVPS